MAKKVKSDTIQSIKKSLRMLPLIGKLVGKPKQSKHKSYYKPADLKTLPKVGANLKPFGFEIAEGVEDLGEYHRELQFGRDPEKELKLPPEKTWDQKRVTPGQASPSWGAGRPKESVGQAGVKPRPPSEAAYYNEYKSPLFKYRKKSSQKEIRRRLESYKTPHVTPAPDHESFYKKPKHGDLKWILKNKPKV